MSTGEPENGSYVLVDPYDLPDSGPHVYRREDGLTVSGGLGVRRWCNCARRLDYPKSWAELTELGDIAYVGKFVDRSEKEEA